MKDESICPECVIKQAEDLRKDILQISLIKKYAKGAIAEACKELLIRLYRTNKCEHMRAKLREVTEELKRV